MSWESMSAERVLADINMHSALSSVPGTHMLEATNLYWATPIGFVYWRWSYDQRIEILYIHVVEPLRKKGVARAMIQKIQSQNPDAALVTMSSTDLSKPFLERTGWQYQINYWLLPINKLSELKRPDCCIESEENRAKFNALATAVTEFLGMTELVFKNPENCLCKYKGREVGFSIHQGQVFVQFNGHIRGQPNISIVDENPVRSCLDYIISNFEKCCAFDDRVAKNTAN